MALDGVFVVLDRLGHLHFKVCELKLVLIDLCLFFLNLLDLLIQVVLDKFAFKKDVDLRILPMVLVVEARVIFGCFDFRFLTE